MPLGTEEPIDIMTYTFELPIWISAPAKVRKMGVVQQIITSIYDSKGTIDFETNSFDVGASFLVTRRTYTPIDFNVVYNNGVLKLYYSDNDIQFTDGTVPSMKVGNWEIAINSFGELENITANSNSTILTNGLSSIRLTNDGFTVVGTVAYHPTDSSLLLFNVDADTLPTNTLSPVDAIINPQSTTVTSAMVNPTVGTRYLIVEPIGSILNNDGNANTIDGPPLWNRVGEPELIADTNDIIQFTGNGWIVAFDSSNVSNVQFVTNLTTSVQYKWKNNQWSKSVEGRYGAGSWSFVP